MTQGKIAQGIVKIIVSANQFQTGFLFTDYGHILSTGHAFQAEKISIGSVITVNFDDNLGDQPYSAELLEFTHDPNQYLDYSVLKITTPEFYFENRIKLPLKTFRLDETKGKKIILAGYAQNLEENVANLFDGRILGTHPLVGSHPKRNNYWIQMKVDSQLTLAGLSGAPVIIDGGVIAIQNRQAIHATNDCYATPINIIKSQVVNQEFKNQNEKFYLNATYFKGFRSTNYNSVQKPNRNVVIVSDFFNEEESTISTTITKIKQKNDISSFIQKCLKKIKQFDNIKFPEIELRILPISKEEIVNINATIQDIENQIESFNEFLRCIIDTGDHLGDKHDKEFEESNIKRSHIIGLQLIKADSEKIEVSWQSGYSIFFRVWYPTVEYANKFTLEVIFGLLIDTIYFHSIVGLRSLISDINAKKRFYEKKAFFGRMEKLKLFGTIEVPRKVGYISFAWSILNNNGKSEFDTFAYNQIWNSFLSGNGGLFQQIQGPNMPMTPLTIDGIIKELNSIPKLSGQISIIKLEKMLRGMGSSLDDQLAAVVILVKKPKKTNDKRVISTYFTKGKKLHSMAILPISKLEAIMTISHLLKFFYFIKK